MDRMINDIKGIIDTSNGSHENCQVFPGAIFQDIPSVGVGRRIAFIDGGNCEIISSPDFSLSIIRLYYSIFEGKNKVLSRKTEFFGLTYAKASQGDIFYHTRIFSDEEALLPSEADLTFSSDEPGMKAGQHRIGISAAAGFLRRLSELKFATGALAEVGNSGIIVLDGSLQSDSVIEKKYLESLYADGLSRDVIISALSKSCSLMSGNGVSFTSALYRMHTEGKWFCNATEMVLPGHPAEIFFAKMHEKSKHVFRFEIYKKQKDYAAIVLSGLSACSADPVFLGYPYGMIDADSFARISNAEKGHYRTIISTKLGRHLSSLSEDAHGILDRISY